MSVQIKKGFLGRHTIRYECPSCATGLTSPLEDAGERDQCPDCSAIFRVPGVEERARILQDEQDARNRQKKRQEQSARSDREFRERNKVVKSAIVEPASALQPGAAPACQGETRLCPFCAEVILAVAQKCKYCREFMPEHELHQRIDPVAPQKSSRRRWVLAAVVAIVASAIIGGIADQRTTSSSTPTPSQPQHFAPTPRADGGQQYFPSFSSNTPSSSAPNWYEGGTLLESGILEWQHATYENKLATCADMVSALWLADSLKPELKENLNSTDDLRVLADELVDFIDAAAERDSDADLNRRMYTNQTVREFGAMGVVIMGWTK